MDLLRSVVGFLIGVLAAMHLSPAGRVALIVGCVVLGAVCMWQSEQAGRRMQAIRDEYERERRS